MKTDDNFILDIKRLGINGEGIGFYNRKAVFVEGAIPGEGHDITIVKEDMKMAFGKTNLIKRVSPYRVEPECPYYEKCGGCSVAHIDYNQMLVFKRELIIEAISRYTSMNYRQFEIKPTVPSDLTKGYRNRSQLAVRKNAEGKYVTLMLQAQTGAPIEVENCLVQNPKINEINNKILQFASDLEITPYLAKFNRGVFRYLITRMNEQGEALICFVCAEKNKKILELAKKVIQIPGVKSVYESFNDSKKSGSFFGEEINLLEGEPYIIEQLGNVKYRIYPNTFFQLNTSQAKKMYDLVLKACKLSRKERVLDAFCGVGSIGLYLANMCKEVVGIEFNKDSVIAATENAKLNKITNASFLQGDANQLFPKMVKEGQVFDVIVVDPPRTGLQEEFIETILKQKVQRMVYVSCNQATLAKDLEKLSEIYKVNSITPIDMFPQTSLVESVCLLVLKDKTK